MLPGDPKGLPDDFIFNNKESLVFVDDGFFRLLKKHFEIKSGKKKKLLQTFRNISNKENLALKHLFFYSSPPFQSEKPSLKENNLRRDYDKIKKMLSRKKWATFREGRCQRLKVGRKYTYNQKSVDILIVIDLMRFDRIFPDITNVILIACDSDFVPAIKQLIKEGVNVILYTYFDRKRNSRFSRYNELLDSCSKWCKLEPEDFD